VNFLNPIPPLVPLTLVNGICKKMHYGSYCLMQELQVYMNLLSMSLVSVHWYTVNCEICLGCLSDFVAAFTLCCTPDYVLEGMMLGSQVYVIHASFLNIFLFFILFYLCHKEMRGQVLQCPHYSGKVPNLNPIVCVWCYS
jgi:hypothetical protein